MTEENISQQFRLKNIQIKQKLISQKKKKKKHDEIVLLAKSRLP